MKKSNDGYITKLVFTEDFTTQYIYEKSLNCTLKIGEFMVDKLYLNKVIK